MFGKVNYVTIDKSARNPLYVKLYDKYPKWDPWDTYLLSNVSITIGGPGISITGRQQICEYGRYWDGEPREIENPEEFTDGDCVKHEITEWNWLRKTKREAYFGTKIWITKKIRPEIEINTSLYLIIDNRQKTS